MLISLINKSYLLLAFSLIFTCSCRPNAPECKYGEPKAIFRQTLPGVKLHVFSIFKHEAVERVVFTDGVEFMLTQSGCDHIRQTFEFLLPGDFKEKEPAFWITESVQLLQRLGNLDFGLKDFNVWAQSIDNQKDDIKLTESTALLQGFYVKIDRILGDQNATLVLTLSDTP